MVLAEPSPHCNVTESVLGMVCFNKIGVSTTVPNSDRTFSDEFIIDEKFGLDGTYSVEVDAGGLYSSTKSFVVPEFGAITIVVMFVAVAAVVLMSSKYTKIMPKL